jgi:glycosyltransferase involved in cell wall biosynthesis
VGSTSGPPTVLFIDHGQSIGGSGVSLVTVLETIGSRARRILAVPQGATRSAVERHGAADRYLPISPVNTRPPRGFAAVAWSGLRILCTTSGETVRAVHANGLLDLLLAAPIAAVRRLRVVVWLHDAEFGTRTIGRAVPLLRRVLPRIVWVAVSDAAANTAADAGLARRAEIVVIPNPIELRPHAVHPPSGKVRVGYLGTDTSRKGFDLLPEIARSLDDATCVLLVFSKQHLGIDEATVRAWSELEQSSAVEIRGRVDDASAAYAECDIVICPSRSESFCRVAAEAMLSGIPVVASDLPAVREVLGDGQAGVLVPPGDPEGFSAAIARLATDGRERARLGAAGRTHAEAFRPTRVVDQLLDLYLADA